MEDLNELDEIEKKILSFMYEKEKKLDEVEILDKELLITMKISTSTLIRKIKRLKNKKFILVQQKQNGEVYLLTNLAKEFLERNEISYFSENDFEEMTYGDMISLKEAFKSIDLLKKEINIVKEKNDKEAKILKTNLEKINAQANKKVETFYGRIGEILALIITAIAMIVFNIQLIGIIEIDFSKPIYAFKTIIAIDLPYMILFVFFITTFHFVIGKDFNTSEKWFKVLLSILLRTLPMLIVIALCYIILIII